MSVFVDTNVPIYASGSDHPLKEACLDVERLIVAQQASFVTDAEVLQEILHRYHSIRRWAQGSRTLHNFARIMAGRIAPISATDVELAGSLAAHFERLQARDLIHLAVMRRLGVTRIVSADRGFDGLTGIERLDPLRFNEWRDSVVTS